MVNVRIEGLCRGACLRISYEDDVVRVEDVDRVVQSRCDMMPAAPEGNARFIRRAIERDDWTSENDAAPYSRILVTQDLAHSSDRPDPGDEI